MTTKVFKNARLFSGEGFTEPKALQVIDGKITEPSAAVGDAEVIDVDGQYVMPGFIESHAHPAKLGMVRLEVDLRPGVVASIKDIQDAVAERVKTAAPGEWVRGNGWDETYLAEGRGPTRDDLDAVAPRNPVVLSRTCGHMEVVNSSALEVSDIEEDIADPAGGRFVRDSGGRMTGLVQEAAMGSIAVPEYSDDEYAQAFQLAQDACVSWGITTMHDLSAIPPHMRYYTRTNLSGDLRVRFRPWLWALDQASRSGVLNAALGAGITSGLGDDWVRIQGMKFSLDGSVGGRTAAVCCAFTNTDDKGLLYLEDDQLFPQLLRAAEGGLRLGIHGIGERAIDQALRGLAALESADYADFVSEKRHRIEHCALPTEEHLEFLKSRGIIAASSVGFIYHLGDSYLAALGPERVKRAYPHRTFIDKGIIAPGNSDTPVTNGNPWEGIYGAVTRTTRSGVVLDAEQNISLAEAIRAYTVDAAYSSFEEETLGSLIPGAHADLQVLQSNPFELESEELLNITPTAVYVAGQAVS